MELSKPVDQFIKPLVKVYLLCAKLPSKYLVQQMDVSRDREVRFWTGDRRAVASRIESIRVRAYEMLRKAFAYVDEYGTWIAVTDEAVEEARNVWKWVSEELKKTEISKIRPDIAIDKQYEIKAIPIYLEPSDAEELLKAAIRHLSEDAEELRRKIDEATAKRKTKELSKLTKRYETARNTLDTFKKFYNTLELRQSAHPTQVHHHIQRIAAQSQTASQKNS
jgi:hypothetical protein